MTTAAKTYVVQFGSAMAAYVVLLIVSIVVIQANPAAPWRFAVALLPVIPAIFGVLAFVRFLGRMDELQQKIQLEGLGFGFGITAIVTFAYGFLENAGLPHLSYIWVLPLMVALWGIGTALAAARYR